MKGFGFKLPKMTAGMSTRKLIGFKKSDIFPSSPMPKMGLPKGKSGWKKMLRDV